MIPIPGSIFGVRGMLARAVHAADPDLLAEV
jgi:hypothetical protein